MTAKKQDASTQKAAAERDYANFVLQANKQIMQSQIQMAIAQIRAEIAMLQGKRNIFNRAKLTQRWEICKALSGIWRR